MQITIVTKILPVTKLYSMKPRSTKSRIPNLNINKLKLKPSFQMAKKELL